MPWIIPIDGIRPQLPEFLAPNATLVGAVRFGPGCSVWFGAVLRGDINEITLGARCNVQDNAVLHVSKARACRLADEVSVGHGAICHACTIARGALVGMHATVLDGAVIGEGSLVAAGCVVPEGLEVPPGHLVAGVPGRVLKPLSAETRERIARIAGDYVAYQRLYPEILAACRAEA
ncbi:MAG: gamma carbonic anhydrase family protein [Planctomycetota bacterium]|nr:gamma carbonic anhydrase family protein [Planctomycetota bacterium]MCX8040751.1 gamma carbonic anhydrase family protein [Planctomycetota bacterium]MDW8373727.1 gamma carbonic anhydrase family protein [Planctomycetota bacterium]